MSDMTGVLIALGWICYEELCMHNPFKPSSDPFSPLLPALRPSRIPIPSHRCDHCTASA